MHTCYTRMMQNKGLSSWYLFVFLACEPLIHGALCLSLSVSSCGNIGSQNHRRRGWWKLWSKIEINIKKELILTERLLLTNKQIQLYAVSNFQSNHYKSKDKADIQQQNHIICCWSTHDWYSEIQHISYMCVCVCMYITYQSPGSLTEKIKAFNS